MSTNPDEIIKTRGDILLRIYHTQSQNIKLHTEMVEMFGKQLRSIQQSSPIFQLYYEQLQNIQRTITLIETLTEVINDLNLMIFKTRSFPTDV